MIKRLLRWLFLVSDAHQKELDAIYQRIFEPENTLEALVNRIVTMPAEPCIECSPVQRGYRVWRLQIGAYHTEVNLN